MSLSFFFERAFRAFFLGGALFSAVAMGVWWWLFSQGGATLSTLTASQWHAHEMVFGYALATVTGFLLTAVMNWSGMNSASGGRLALLFAFWGLARLGYLLDWPLLWIALLDLAFNLGLALHFGWPVWHKKLGQQWGLAAKFVLLLGANMLFYALALGWLSGSVWSVSVQVPLLLGLFLVLAINLTMLRRVLPFFTEKTLGLSALKEFKWLDRFAMLGFLLLMVCVIGWPGHWLTTLVAWPLAAVFMVRQIAWYHPGIWRQVLLWPLHLSYGFITLGIALYGFVGLQWLAPTLALHALAAGGIGLLCSSMMARIGLGHTGRNVFEPPRFLVAVFVLLAVAAVVRVVLPMVFPSHYGVWVGVSQWAWMAAFALLFALYWRILTRPNLPKNSGIRL